MMRIFLVLAALFFVNYSFPSYSQNQSAENTDSSDPFEESPTMAPEQYEDSAAEELPLPPQDQTPMQAPLSSENESSVLVPPQGSDAANQPAQVPPLPTPPQSQDGQSQNRAPIEQGPVLPSVKQQELAIEEYKTPVDCTGLTEAECEEKIRQMLRRETMQQPAPGDQILQPQQNDQTLSETNQSTAAFPPAQNGFAHPPQGVPWMTLPLPPPQNEYEATIQNEMRMNMARMQAMIASQYSPSPWNQGMVCQPVCAPTLVIQGELATSLHQTIVAFANGPIYYPHVYRGNQIEFYGQASQNMRDLLTLNYQTNLEVFANLFQPVLGSFSVMLTPYEGEDIAARDQAILQLLQTQLTNLQ